MPQLFVSLKKVYILQDMTISKIGKINENTAIIFKRYHKTLNLF